MSSRNVIQTTVDAWAKDAGFAKRSGSWYSPSDEVVELVQLQKSQYGPSYYVNIGFWLQRLEAKEYPKEWDCHIRVRLTAFPQIQKERIDALLDLERDIDDETRSEALKRALDEVARPVLEKGATSEGLARMMANGAFARGLVDVRAKELLATHSA